MQLIAWVSMVYLGLTFGLSFSIVKIILREIESPLVILFWQSCFSSVLLFAFSVYSLNSLKDIINNIGALTILACFGVIVPNFILYLSAAHLSAGAISIILALIPFCAYIIALILRIEKLELVRLFGVILGFAAILFLVFPENANNKAYFNIWFLSGLLVPIFIASTNIFLSSVRFKKVKPVHMAFGMNFLSAAILSLMLPSNVNFWLSTNLTKLVFCVFLLSFIGSIGFIIFIKLVKNYGPVFASQVNYLITISGIMWGYIILSEVHSMRFWISLLLIIGGLFLVRPIKIK
jgi:drug/metabolite transporter (DMT)-like permease|tara:strand:- start:1720 stop:2595 length:876 start_codon:yes stop_codon:yes gene_type:complete